MLVLGASLHCILHVPEIRVSSLNIYILCGLCIIQAFHAAFVECDEEVITRHKSSGTTATLAVQVGPTPQLQYVIGMSVCRFIYIGVVLPRNDSWDRTCSKPGPVLHELYTI